MIIEKETRVRHPMELTNAIRDQVICGNCTSSTLLLWKNFGISESVRGSHPAKLMIQEPRQEHDLSYLVRCSFFKMNVAQPEEILHCEGFKAKN